MGLAFYQYYKISIYLVGIYYLGLTGITAIGYVLGGYLADFIGRKKAMVSFASLSGTSLLLSLINPFIFIMLMYFFSNAYSSSFTTTVGGTSKSVGGLIKSFSRVRIGINAGWAIGPAIGGVLYTKFGFSSIMLIGGIASLLSVPLMLGLENIKGAKTTFIKPNKRFSKFIIPAFLSSMVMGQLGLPFVLYFSRIFSVSTIGVMYAINGGLVALFQDIVGRKFSNKPPKKSLMVGMMIYSLSYGSMMIINKVYELVVAVVALTLAEMIISPISNSVANFLAEERNRGKYMGLYGLTSGIGRTFGQSLSTELSFSSIIEWGDVSAIAIIGGILYLLLTEIP
ncbi:MAG: MFS transporter [Caldisphaeraceae archaeon]|nr:MFS transporter [Caldisphaeraceae archaeon]MEB3797648.1 MFS transporter [Caldisphaeraceae archaeon]